MNKISHEAARANFERSTGLSGRIADRGFRASYMAHSLRAFLADQIRALRGDRSQKSFGELIGKPQSVVSRLESENYGKVTLQTMLDIADKLDIALLVRYVDFPTFVISTADFSESAVAPKPFAKDAFDEMLHEAPGQGEPSVALRGFLSASYEQNFAPALQSVANTHQLATDGALPSHPMSRPAMSLNWNREIISAQSGDAQGDNTLMGASSAIGTAA